MKQKHHVRWATCLMMLLLLLTGCRVKPEQLSFDGQALIMTQREDSAEVYQSAAGRTLQLERDDQGAKITVDGQVYQVRGSQRQSDVTFPDGRELTWTVQGSGSTGSTGMGVEASMDDWNRVEELHELVYGSAAEEPVAGAAARVLFGLVAIAFGILEMLKPRLAWQIAEGWRYENLEPSEAFLILSRLGGAVLVVIGLLLVLGVL